MKADAGSWLYIVLSIAFLILSAIGNKKKKPTSSTEPVNDDYEPAAPAEREWPRSFEDVLNEVLEKPKPREVIVEKPQSWSRETVLDNPYHSYERIEDEAQSLETIEEEVFSYEAPVLERKDEKPIYTPIVVEKEIKRTEESEPVLSNFDFDLRQGIIYAEILNRKYF